MLNACVRLAVIMHGPIHVQRAAGVKIAWKGSDMHHDHDRRRRSLSCICAFELVEADLAPLDGTVE